MIAPASDAKRRDDLRTFLAKCRSRLQPADVGLPLTANRRVPGLRREEVAELTGVSNDWYRWFESGRPIRVSPQFVTRLGRVLRLDAFGQRMLHHLALPEIYQAETAVRPVPDGRSLLSPIESISDIEPAFRTFAWARDEFLSGAAIPAGIRSRIARSWQRSKTVGADPLREVVPAAVESDAELAEIRHASEAMLQAADPILSRLGSLFLESGFAIVITDAMGCVLDISGRREILRSLSRIDFEPGGDLSERACGTNAIGTAIADGSPLQLMGAENFCEGGADLTCAAAPIRDSSTHEIIGALDVTGGYERIQPQILTLVVQSALEIEERLAAGQPRQ